MKKFCLPLLLILPLPVLAQTNTQPAPIQFTPSYFVGAGISYDYYGKTGFAALTTFGAKVTSSTSSKELYSFTTLDMTQASATIKTGLAYTLLNSNNWSIMALGDGGVNSGSGNILGAFSGGGFISYDIGFKLTKDSHFLISAGGRVLNITSATVQPIFELGLTKVF